ncbi:XdhC/CoxI family protein [uncultured Thiodictyon sp.]|uniref:XdhC family protein n=1 Tax=uncultured Thiodictyon sp. TaxID=1846217 RepID=UPI0025D19008|nr:XdhC/CoxI family protein [uncultured Thiodictyon sp.]
MKADRWRAGYTANDADLFSEIIKLSRNGCPSVLATVIESIGSSPRKAGAKMLVRSDGSTLGSVGGGRVEREVIAAAMLVLEENRSRVVSFNLTQEYDHVCGGTMRIYLEPSELLSKIVIIGAGHIGTALSALARFTGFHVTVIDERDDYASPKRLADAHEVMAAPVAEALARVHLRDSAAIVIAGTGFEQDLAAVRAALATPAGYIGVIGSQRKKAVMSDTLTKEGYGVIDIARVITPIGLNIMADTPQEIAVSVIAQLIIFRKRNGKSDRSHHAGGGCVPADGMLQTTAAARVPAGDCMLP